MPYLLPRSFPQSEKVALVLAFGNLSLLEICSRMAGSTIQLESPCERICVATVGSEGLPFVRRFVGIHKAGPLALIVDPRNPDFSTMVKTIAEQIEHLPALSLSGYCMDGNDYEELVRSLLNEFRSAGFKKVHLLRPKGNELVAEQILSRGVFDIMGFPYKDGFALGPTAWVPDSAAMRRRGFDKPVPRSEISISPRLASLLLNLAGLSPGQILLDPFCGSGTILSEALLRSYRCLGFDTNARRIDDARRNLKWASRGLRAPAFDVRVGDARNLSRVLGETKVDAVVTEPVLLPSLDARPSTSTANELVGEAGKVYEGALASMAEVLSRGARVVMVVPIVRTIEGEEVSIGIEGRPLGFHQYQPGPIRFVYPVRPAFESTRWVRRGVYVFESRS